MSDLVTWIQGVPVWCWGVVYMTVGVACSMCINRRKSGLADATLWFWPVIVPFLAIRAIGRRTRCEHQWVWWRNIHGDEINATGCRTVWHCAKCQRVRYDKEYVPAPQPYPIRAWPMIELPAGQSWTDFKFGKLTPDGPPAPQPAVYGFTEQQWLQPPHHGPAAPKWPPPSAYQSDQITGLRRELKALEERVDRMESGGAGVGKDTST